MNTKSFIGDKAFYKMACGIALPILVQNFITNFVSMLDNLMVGSLGTEQMSGVSIANQLIFVFNLAVFGAVSGAGIFTSQFHGKNDENGIRFTVRYKTLITLGLTAVAILIFIFSGDFLIELFLHEADASADLDLTKTVAKEYLNIILIGLIPFSVSQIFASTLRETGYTVIPMLTGFSAVATNTLFNYLLIFGKFGFPLLECNGAAVATVISRYVECAVLLVYVLKKRNKFPYFKGAFKSFYIPKELTKNITLKGAPLLLNEFLWSSGMSILNMGYSLHGISVVAGYSISSTVVNLSSIAFQAFGLSISIIIGKQLGAGKFNEAVLSVKKLITLSIGISVLVGIFIYSISGVVTELYNTSADSKEYATYFLKVSGIFAPFAAFAHASYFTLRSGGKTLITFVFDSVFLLCFSVPLVFSLYYIFDLSIWWIFPIAQATDIIKDIIGFILIKKRVWVNNIVE